MFQALHPDRAGWTKEEVIFPQFLVKDANILLRFSLPLCPQTGLHIHAQDTHPQDNGMNVNGWDLPWFNRGLGVGLLPLELKLWIKAVFCCKEEGENWWSGHQRGVDGAQTHTGLSYLCPSFWIPAFLPSPLKESQCPSTQMALYAQSLLLLEETGCLFYDTHSCNNFCLCLAWAFHVAISCLFFRFKPP